MPVWTTPRLRGQVRHHIGAGQCRTAGVASGAASAGDAESRKLRMAEFGEAQRGILAAVVVTA